MKAKKNNLSGPNLREEIPGYGKKQDVFRVPDGYFDRLPGRISDAVSEKGRRGIYTGIFKERIVIKRILIPVLTVSVVIVAFLIFRPGSQTGDDALVNLHDTLNLNKAFDASYAAEAQTADYRLTEELLEEAGQNTEFDPSNDFYLDDQVDDSAIIDYLSEQELDGSLLAEL